MTFSVLMALLFLEVIRDDMAEALFHFISPSSGPSMSDEDGK